MQIYVDESERGTERYEVVMAWLRENLIDSGHVVAGSVVSEDGHEVTATVCLRDIDGHTLLDGNDLARGTLTVPQRAPLPESLGGPRLIRWATDSAA